MLVFDIMATGGNLSETYIRVRTNTLDEQDTKLRLPGLDRLVEQLASMEGAVGRVKDTDRAATRDEVIQQLLKCIQSKLSSRLVRACLMILFGECWLPVLAHRDNRFSDSRRSAVVSSARLVRSVVSGFQR